MNARVLDIGEVAKRSRLPVSTLRYYEQRGLITSVGRRGLRRLFDASVLDRLAFITMGRMAHFSLDELAGMMQGDGRIDIDRKRVGEKADALDRKIRELSALSNCLRHVAVCPADNHFSCATFKQLLRTAGRRQSSGQRTRFNGA